MRSMLRRTCLLIAVSAALALPGPAAAAPVASGAVTPLDGISGARTGHFVTSFPVVAGATVRVTLSAPGNATFSVSLRPPGSAPVSSRLVVTPVAPGSISGQGQQFTYVAGATGTFGIDVTAASSRVTYGVSWSIQDPPAQSDRYAGASRYDTAIAISRKTFPSSGECTNVVLATGSNYPDALAASALAGSYDCPILLTRPDGLPPTVLAEIDRLRSTQPTFTVWIAGGESAVAASVADELAGHGLQVTRLGGKSRYGTAALIAAEVRRHEVDDLHHAWTGAAFVSNGLNYPDALAASPYSASQRMPILLVTPWSVPQETLDAISDLHITNATVLGGTSAVQDTTMKALRVHATRVFGANRFITAQRMLDTAVANGWASRATLGVATGRNFPDALAASAYLAANNGGLLLGEPDGIGDATYDYVAAHPASVSVFRVFGSSAAVSDRVFWSYLDALNAMDAAPRAASSAVTPQGLPAPGYQLKYDSEFDLGQLDSSVWLTSSRWGRDPTHDLEHYSAEALRTGNGLLTFTASRGGFGRPYTSAAISSIGRFQFKYGYAEIRARIPKGQGLWPAFWLGAVTPSLSDEIDIMEMRGEAPSQNYMVVHWLNSAGQKREIRKIYAGPDFSRGFHTYACDWTPDRIVWYIDGVERFRVSKTDPGAHIPSCDMYLTANLALGGWVGTPALHSVPAALQVDYIRVYQR